MSSRVLTRALRLAKTVSALAAALGVSERTVAGWRTRGVPKEREAALLEFVGSKARERKAASEDRHAFAELMKLSGEIGLLPEVKSSSGRYAGPQTIGQRFTKGVNRKLSPEVIRLIVAWVMAQAGKRKFPWWQAVIMLSEYGAGDFGHARPTKVGTQYPHVFVQLAHPKTHDFTPNVPIPTFRSKSLREVADEIREDLEGVLERGHIAYVHRVDLKNYRLRTEEERRAWETFQRRLREKALKKKEKATVWQKEKSESSSSSSPDTQPSEKSTLKKTTKKRSSATTRSGRSTPSTALKKSSSKSSVKKVSKPKTPTKTTKTKTTKKTTKTTKRSEQWGIRKKGGAKTASPKKKAQRGKEPGLRKPKTPAKAKSGMTTSTRKKTTRGMTKTRSSTTRRKR